MDVETRERKKPKAANGIWPWEGSNEFMNKFILVM